MCNAYDIYAHQNYMKVSDSSSESFLCSHSFALLRFHSTWMQWVFLCGCHVCMCGCVCVWMCLDVSNGLQFLLFTLKLCQVLRGQQLLLSSLPVIIKLISKIEFYIYFLPNFCVKSRFIGPIDLWHQKITEIKTKPLTWKCCREKKKIKSFFGSKLWKHKHIYA